MALFGRKNKPNSLVETAQHMTDVMTETHYNKTWAFWVALRPQQWVKNAFVVAPLLFSRQFHDAAMCFKTLLALVAFCAASSAVYVINDLCDRPEDRNHPVKKNRPIPSGRISTTKALILALVLLGLSLLIGSFLNAYFVLCVMLYALLNVIYSLGVKHIAILDVMTIAAGFVLRILAGSAAISLIASHWLLLCTVMISVFLGFTKRRAELVAADQNQRHTRTVLKDYSVPFLDQVISMVTSATIVCYILYAIDDRTVEAFGSRAMLLTVPSVMYGMFRYIYVIYHYSKGEDPTRSLLRDVPTVINLVVWIVVALVVVSYGSRFDPFG